MRRANAREEIADGGRQIPTMIRDRERLHLHEPAEQLVGVLAVEGDCAVSKWYVLTARAQTSAR